MTLRDPEAMSPEQVAMALKNAHVMETWISAVKAHAFEILKAGGAIPGYKLGYGAKKRVWKFSVLEEAVAEMRKLGVTQEEMYPPPELISLPKMEKVLKAKGAWPVKKRGAPRPATPLDRFTDYSIPEPRVMPIEEHDEMDDRRDDASKEFA